MITAKPTWGESALAADIGDAFREAVRYRGIEDRIQTFEQPDGTYLHWLLLSVRSESPDPGEAIDELHEKRNRKGKRS